MSSMAEGGICYLQTLQFEGSSSRIDRCLERNGHWLPESCSAAGQLSHPFSVKGRDCDKDLSTDPLKLSVLGS